MPGTHAILSPSSAHRWLRCTPSARIEEEIGDDSSSIYAEEGSLAHEYSEARLRYKLGLIGESDLGKIQTKVADSPFNADEIVEETAKYVDFVWEEYVASKKRFGLLFIEQKVDFSGFVPEGTGTCDAVIIADGTMQILDLKYGKGIRVEAEENSQLKLYALGALEKYKDLYEIDTVELNICQPRLDRTSKWAISTTDLYKWAEKEVRPKAEKAFEGQGVQVAGDHCRFCKAAGRCATLASQNLKVAQHEFKDPHLLTDAQILEVHELIPRIAHWIDAVGDYMLQSALDGKKWQGLKVVEGRSQRKWADSEKVLEFLKSKKYKIADIAETKVKGIGAIEKFLGDKFDKLMSPFIVKPEGKPALVPESDKRPELNSAKEDFKD